MRGSPSRDLFPPPSAEWIDLWAVRLVAPEPALDLFRRVLSPDEYARASRFQFDHLKHSYLISTGSLRALIGRYLGTDPARVRFEFGQNGKPRVGPNQEFCFNASHSGSLGLFAFTVGCELGIDVERIRPLSGMNEIAARFFCAGEAAELLALPDSERLHAFFLCWTRKEAYLKATGEGLSASLNQFQVALRPRDVCRIIHCDPCTPEEWALHNLKPAPGFAAALAYRGPRRRVRLFGVLEPASLLANRHATSPVLS